MRRERESGMKHKKPGAQPKERKQTVEPVSFEHKIEKARETVRQRAIERGNTPEGFLDESQQEELAWRIESLVEPVLKHAGTEVADRTVGVAISAWDVSLLSPEHQVGAIRDLVEIACSYYGERYEGPFLDMISYFMKQKEDHYPDDKRWITTHEVVVEGDRYQVVLIALKEGPEKAEEPGTQHE